MTHVSAFRSASFLVKADLNTPACFWGSNKQARGKDGDQRSLLNMYDTELVQHTKPVVSPQVSIIGVARRIFKRQCFTNHLSPAYKLTRVRAGPPSASIQVNLAHLHLLEWCSALSCVTQTHYLRIGPA